MTLSVESGSVATWFSFFSRRGVKRWGWCTTICKCGNRSKRSMGSSCTSCGQHVWHVEWSLKLSQLQMESSGCSGARGGGYAVSLTRDKWESRWVHSGFGLFFANFGLDLHQYLVIFWQNNRYHRVNCCGSFPMVLTLSPHSTILERYSGEKEGSFLSVLSTKG